LRQRNYTGKKFTLNGVTYDSRQERDLHNAYKSILYYHPQISIDYSMNFVYKPDFRLGIDSVTGLAVYLEAKEYFSSDMVPKYLSIVNCNPGLFLLILTPNISEKDRLKLKSHPRIDVLLERAGIPVEWLARLK
jgi:hypothetical protein